MVRRRPNAQSRPGTQLENLSRALRQEGRHLGRPHSRAVPGQCALAPAHLRDRRIGAGFGVDQARIAGYAFSQTNSQHGARNPEILHRARERERIRRDDADRALEIHEGLLVEALRVDDGGVDVGEYLELIRATHVVAVARGAVRDDLAAIGGTHLPRGKGLDHSVLGGHAPDPPIALDAHVASTVILGNTEL